MAHWYLTRKREFIACKLVKSGRGNRVVEITEPGHPEAGKHKTLPPEGVVTGKLYPRLFESDTKPTDFVEISGRVLVKHANSTRYMVPDETPYRWQRITADVIDSILASDKVLLTGEAGTGKTSLVEQIASRIGQPVLRVNLNGETRLGDFIGRTTVIAGETGSVTKWVDGILPTAMKNGYWLILDEIDMAEPNILSLLHPVLEPHGRLVLKENAGEEIRPHPGFRLFGTANGVGSQSGRADVYAGVNTMNEAFMDRWHVISMPHIEAKVETKILSERYPLLLKKHARRIVQFANMVRAGAEGAVVNMTFSTRRCLQWAEKTAMYRNPLKAAEAVFLCKASPEDRAVLEKVIGTVFGGKRARREKTESTTKARKSTRATSTNSPMATQAVTSTTYTGTPATSPSKKRGRPPKVKP